MNVFPRSSPSPRLMEPEPEGIMLGPIQHSQASAVPDSQAPVSGRSSQDHLLRPSPSEHPQLSRTSSHVQDVPRGSAVDSSEPILREAGSAMTTRNPLQEWVLETIAMATATAVLVALIVLLSQYDGIQQPDWPTWLNLSTVVSILSTALRTLLTFVVASVIGHEKWIWLDRVRPLRQVELFDDASRGSWGSFLLFFKAPRAYVAISGASIMVLSLATGSFMQQTLKTTVCQTPAREVNGSMINGTVAAAFRAPATADLLQCGNRKMCPAPGLRAAMAGGLTNPGSTASSVLFQCPTGNCTFTEHNGVTYSSIAYCSSCEDVTEDIKEAPLAGGSDFNDTQAEIDQGYVHYLSAGEENVTISYGDVRNSWLTVRASEDEWWSANFTVLSFTRAGCQETANGDETSVDCTGGSDSNAAQHEANPFLPADLNMVAARCTVRPCLRNYHGAVRNGRLEETVVSRTMANGSNGRWSHNTGGHPGKNIPVAQSPCLVDGAWYDWTNFTAVPRRPGRNFTSLWQDGHGADVPWECTYFVLFVYPGALLDFFQAALNGSCGTGDYTSTMSTQPMCPEASWMLAPLWRDGQATLASTADVLEGLATAITNRLRNTGAAAYDPENAFGYYNATGPALVGGAAWETTVCTRVEWPWIALPAALTVATAVLLAGVAGKSWRDRAARPVWKASILPLLFHGPRAETRARGGEADSTVPLATLGDMRQVADGMHVKLGKGEVDMVLVGMEDEKTESSIKTRWRGRASRSESRLDVDSLYGD